MQRVACSLIRKTLVVTKLIAIAQISICPVVWADQPSPNPSEGRRAYLQACARCHGVEGRGDGVDAKRFYPRPRDFTHGVYKFRSTASGTPPTDEDLFQTVTHGLPGTHMPDWRHLDEASRLSLVDYLKSLSDVFQTMAPEPLAIAQDPGAHGADLTKGKSLYEQLGCAACHGQSGRANGSSAAGLVDDWGAPIRPANLTQGWNYRGGAKEHSVMVRVLSGIDGAGMPSYAGVVSPEDAWHLAYYVTSLQEPLHSYPILRGTYMDGSLPERVDDPRWETVEHTQLILREAVNAQGEWSAPLTVNAVSLQVLADKERLAFRLVWDDPSQESETPADALALVLKPNGLRGDVVSLQAWPYQGSPALDLCYYSAQTGQVFETIAKSFEDLLLPGRTITQPSVSLAGQARFEDGRWSLVIQRPRVHDALPDATKATSNDVLSVALVVWDGGLPTVRAVSVWTDVIFPTQDHGSDK